MALVSPTGALLVLSGAGPSRQIGAQFMVVIGADGVLGKVLIVDPILPVLDGGFPADVAHVAGAQALLARVETVDDSTGPRIRPSAGR